MSIKHLSKILIMVISFVTSICIGSCVISSGDSALTDLSLEITETTITADGSTVLTAVPEVSGDPTITYSWTITEGSSYAKLSQTSGSQVSLTGTNSSDTEQTVTVNVTATDGTSTYKEKASIIVQAGNCVTGVSITGPNLIQYDKVTNLIANTSVSGTPVLTYSWEITEGESYASISSSTEESVTLTANNTSDSQQEVTVKVTVSDNNGNSKSASFTVTLSANGVEVKDALTGVKASATKTSILSKGSTTLTASPVYTGSLSEITVSYTWSITEGDSYASLESYSGESVTINANNESESEQNVTVKVSATDGENTFDTTVVITVAMGAVESDTLYLDLTNKKVSYNNSEPWFYISTSAVEPIVNVKVKFTEDDSGGSTGLIKVNASSLSGVFNLHIYGSMTEGGVKVQTNGSDTVNVYLEGTTITSTNYPCLDITKGAQANVILSGTNTFTDGRSYGIGYGEEYSTSSGDTYYDEDTSTYVSCTVSKSVIKEGSDHKGSLYNKGNLTISGSGSLSITQAYKNCIASKEGILTIDGGTLNLKNYTSSSDTGKSGLFGAQGIIVNDGSITFDGKGIISTSDIRKANGFNTDDETYSSSYVKINGGSTSITTYNGKGINVPKIYISGGRNTFTVTGTTSYSESSKSGSWYDADGVKESGTVKYSPEGIEAASLVEISGGSTIISAPDDGINVSGTGGSLTISDGFLYVKSQGDGLDSNGNITISGGVTVVSQTGGGNSPIDCGDNYKFSVTGSTATVFAIGSNGMFTESIPTSTSIPMIYSTSLSSKSSLGVDGIIAVVSPQSYGAAVLVSPSISSGSSYSFVGGGTISGTLYNEDAQVYLPASISGGSSTSCTATTSYSGGSSFGGPGSGGSPWNR